MVKKTANKKPRAKNPRQLLKEIQAKVRANRKTLKQGIKGTPKKSKSKRA